MTNYDQILMALETAGVSHDINYTVTPDGLDKNIFIECARHDKDIKGDDERAVIFIFSPTGKYLRTEIE